MRVRDYVTREDDVYVEIREFNTHDCFDCFGALLYKGEAKNLYEKRLESHVLKAITSNEGKKIVLLLYPDDFNVVFRDDYFVTQLWHVDDVRNVIAEECYYNVDDIMNYVDFNRLEYVEDCTEDQWGVITNEVHAAIKKYEQDKINEK